MAFKPPLDIDEKLVPFVRMATVAMTSLRVSSAEFGDTVAIIGLGLVGNFRIPTFQFGWDESYKYRASAASA